MGQRHQLFIKVNNPLKNESLGLEGEDLKKARKMFGGMKYTILAIHHQWLYGRSALYMAKHILNITNPKTANTYSPFGERFYGQLRENETPLKNYIKQAMMMLQVITDPDFPRGTGIEGMHFLNEQCIDDETGKYTENWDMRKDFTGGDNNDGITIIDAIEQKYCFMNIHDFDYGDEELTDIYRIPKFTPASALDYVTAYYPEEEDRKDNKEIVNKLFKGYSTLNSKEIGKMFPKMKVQLGLEKKKTAKA